MYKVIKSINLDILVVEVRDVVAAGGKILGGLTTTLTNVKGDSFEVYANRGSGFAYTMYMQAVDTSIEDID